MTAKELQEALASAIHLIQELGTAMPDNMYHPDYGWIIKDGKVSKFTEKFYNDYQEKK